MPSKSADKENHRKQTLMVRNILYQMSTSMYRKGELYESEIRMLERQKRSVSKQREYEYSVKNKNYLDWKQNKYRILTGSKGKKRLLQEIESKTIRFIGIQPVSYTHLDVYKRQVCVCVCV